LSFYLDTSLLVAAFTKESATARVEDWLRNQNTARLSISLWVTVELSSALALKQRTGHLESDERASVLAEFTRMTANSLTVLPISDSDFHAAARFVDRSALGLRASDALHLAVCLRHGETLCTLDRRLAEAGMALGVKTLLI